MAIWVPGEPDDNTWQSTYVINVQDKECISVTGLTGINAPVGVCLELQVVTAASECPSQRKCITLLLEQDK